MGPHLLLADVRRPWLRTELVLRRWLSHLALETLRQLDIDELHQLTIKVNQEMVISHY